MSLSRVIEKWDHIAYFLYNILARVIYFLNYFKISKYVKRNKKFKNKHKGKKCFIILNGPSASKEDLSKLEGQIVFCVNSYYRGDKINLIKPDYYCITDDAFFLKGNQGNLQDLLQKCPYSTFFFNYKYLRHNKIADYIYVTYAKYMPNAVKIKNDYDGLCSGFTNVALYVINLAIFMGFTKIYLLGLDFNLNSELNWAHDYPESNNELKIKNKIKETFEKDLVCGIYWYYSHAHYQFYYMNNYAEKMGVSIINLNPNSAVRAFPFGDYNDVILKR